MPRGPADVRVSSGTASSVAVTDDAPGCAALLVVEEGMVPPGIAQILISDFYSSRYFKKRCGTAVELVRRVRVDLTLLGSDVLNDEWFEYVPLLLNEVGAGQTVFFTEHKDARLVRAIRAARHASAIHCGMESLGSLRTALHTIAGGGRYLSPIFAAACDSTYWRQIESMLTPEAERVLSVLGCGSDDAETAARLELTTGAVASWRKRLMRMFDLHHRGELTRFAFRHGFSVETDEGNIRPGIVLPAKSGPRP